MAIYYGSGRTTGTISTNTTLAAGVYEYQNLTVNSGITLTVLNSAIILVKGTLALNGTIEVSNPGTGGLGGVLDSVPSNSSQGGTGGDAGGNISVIANTITGSGTIRARGGSGTGGVAGTSNFTQDWAGNAARRPGVGIPLVTPFTGGYSKPPITPLGGMSVGAVGGIAFQYGIGSKIGYLWDFIQNSVIYQLKQGGLANSILQAGSGGGGSSGAWSTSYAGAGGPGGAGGTMFGVGGNGGSSDNANGMTTIPDGYAGAGGGGAGGVILLVCPIVSSALNLDASGGAGGNAAGLTQNVPRGGGGGGGGGGLILSFTDKDLNSMAVVSGGAAGLKSANTVNVSGASDGTMGTAGQYLYLPISTYLS
ncbi:hypothetical protein [Paenibacillus glycanilyticus]|uniref:hypothetical protein n=1 Tax=Paenibacillus glycanilyticus TaxID=126569 RepID=UPI0019107C52|nr:hypothetical protein [Paenibacillus glycanilyticus]